MRLFHTIGLASRDYRHEWRMSSCFVLALAAVLGPMLVLFGLKFGIVGGMIGQLIEDPANREVRPVGSGRYDNPWLLELQRRADVAFVVPRTRSIAATLELNNPSAGRILNTELVPSRVGDPLLEPHTPVPRELESLVLSQSAAAKLEVQPGDTIDGSLLRRYRGQRERVHLRLQVRAIAPAAAFARDGAFADPKLVEALEDFRDGHAVPSLGWAGESAAGERSYPSFRLYAESIYDVAGLAQYLIDNGVDVRTRAADIDLVIKMERNLSTIYWAIAVIGLIGFSLSLGASLWANVDRKRKELAVLRLVGFRTGDIVWFPITQAAYTAILGWALAVVIYQGAALAINQMLSEQLAAGQQVCVLLPEHYLIALGVTTLSAVLAAGLAGVRSSRVAPADGLREI